MKRAESKIPRKLRGRPGRRWWKYSRCA